MLIGTLFPLGVPDGICTTNTMTPASNPGASPAYAQSAGWPLIVTSIGSSGPGVTCGGGKVAVVIEPSTPKGLVWPTPVAYSSKPPPRLAGVAVEFRDNTLP